MPDRPTLPSPALPARSAIVAALFGLLPGGGHFYLGAHQAGRRWLAPPLLLAAALASWLLIAGTGRVLGALLLPAVGLGLAAVMLVAGVWHAVSLLDVGRRLWRRQRHAASWGITGVLAVLVMLPYLWSGMVGIGLANLSGSVFKPTQLAPGGQVVVGSDDPIPGVTGSTDAPLPSPATIDARISLLLVGSDDLALRDCCGLTDTLMLLSYEPQSNELTIVSLPRDIASFPLYNGAIYNGKINSLLSFAAANPDVFGGTDPYEVLRTQVGFILGIAIDHYVLLDLNTAIYLADVLGGLTVNNPVAIADPDYIWFDGDVGLAMPVGEQRLNSEQLIAFIRSRSGPENTDFLRAARQQEVIVALQRELLSPSGLARLPAVLDVVADNIRTDLPRDSAVGLLSALADNQPRIAERIVLEAPYTIHPSLEETGGSWELRLDIERVAELSRRLFGSDSSYAAR